MKNLFLLLGLILSIGTAAQDALISSTPQAVTVYHSGALVKRSASVTISKGQTTLELKGVSSMLVMSSFQVVNDEITVLSKELLSNISDREMALMIDTKESLEGQLLLLNSKYDESTFVGEVKELEQMMAFYGRKVVELKSNIRDANNKIMTAERMRSMSLKNDEAAILKVEIFSKKAFKGTLNFNYVVGAVGWAPAYDVEASLKGSNELGISYNARVMNQTGEDWKGVALTLSSSFPLLAPSELPQPSNTWVVGGQVPTLKPSVTSANVNSNQIQQLKGVEYRSINIPAFLLERKLEGSVTILSNGTVYTFPVLETTLPASYFHLGFPMLNDDVYIAADVNDWESYGFIDGIANVAIDGNNVGQVLIAFSEASGTLTMPLGKDNLVYMDRREMADLKYFKSTMIGKRNKTTLAYAYELKNNHDYSVEFRLKEMVPISQSNSSEVQLDELSGGIVDPETGELTWTMTLAGGKADSKTLIYTVEKVGSFVVSSPQQNKQMSKEVNGMRQQYRSVSCPYF